MPKIPSDAGARRVRRRRARGIVALLLIVVGAAWLVSRNEAPSQLQQPASASEEPESRPGAKPSMASVPLPAPTPRRVNTARATPEDDAACGIEPAPAASAPLSEAAMAASQARTARVFEQTMAAMQNSADPQARAVGLVLKPLIAELERIRKEDPLVPCEPPKCVPVPQPASAAELARKARPDAAADASFDALARMAAATADPRIYAFAFHACDASNVRRDGACQLITARQWARLDPGNAVPWAFVAAAAQLQGDAATVGEAMHQIAQARRSDHGWGTLPALVLEHSPVASAALEATHELLVSVIGVEAAWVIPGYQTISPFCKAEALLDTNRRETCRQIAEVLAEKSDTLLDRSFGASIGRRVGWPAERADAIKAEFAALSQAVADSGVDPDQPTCAALRRSVDYIRTLGTDGELGAMRRLASSTPSNLGAHGGDKPKSAGYAGRAN